MEIIVIQNNDSEKSDNPEIELDPYWDRQTQLQEITRTVPKTPLQEWVDAGMPPIK